MTDRQKPRTGEAPTAELTVEIVSEAADDYVAFDASDSRDTDSSSLEYRFDYDYDGTWDADWSDTPTARAPAAMVLEDGAVVGKVQVRDELGQRAAALARFERPSDPMADAGIDAGDDAGPADDTGSQTDVGSEEDGGPVTWGDVDVKLANDSGGCNCRTTGETPPVGWLLALFGVVALRRRRSY